MYRAAPEAAGPAGRSIRTLNSSRQHVNKTSAGLGMGLLQGLHKSMYACANTVVADEG